MAPCSSHYGSGRKNSPPSIDALVQSGWKNLAPNLVRQRLIIEATTPVIAEPPELRRYLTGLACVTNMKIVSGPYVYSAHECGFGGWVHWRTSGAHVYSYPARAEWGNEYPLVTVDTYTCKPFSISEVVDFTREFFKAIELVHREIKV